MIYRTKVSGDYLKKDKYHLYRKCMWAMLVCAALVAVMVIVCMVYPYYNGNTNQLTAEEFQNSIVTVGGIFGIMVALAIMYLVLAKWELNKVQKEDLEKSLHGEQKEKEKIDNFNPFI